jgi:ribosomal 50S subunit-associated protein YjgA (DUF615 family)
MDTTRRDSILQRWHMVQQERIPEFGEETGGLAEKLEKVIDTLERAATTTRPRQMGMIVTRRLREMTFDDIAKIADTFQAFDDGTLEDVKGFCAAVTTEEIAKQDYILTPGRYVGIEEQEDDGEPFERKMARLTGELSEMFKRSHELEDEIRKRLGAIGYDI